MKNILNITKALADEGRLKILLMLGGAELCVCHITEALALAPSTVSKHLSILERAGLIETRKKGRWVHCRLPSGPGPGVKGALNWLFLSSGKKLRRAGLKKRCRTEGRK
ncbi:MAG: winged helix-turn-helix transcriptional regulator [Elusimicrobia bacterium]|nr:winged helix-turn-helix transcriptional regulator [Elusimicrobiota bacterium]